MPCWGQGASPWQHQSSGPAWPVTDQRLWADEMRHSVGLYMTEDAPGRLRILHQTLEVFVRFMATRLLISQKWLKMVQVALWTLTVVLTQDETVHAPQPKHVQEVPGCRAHPKNTQPTSTCLDRGGWSSALCSSSSHQEASSDSRSMPRCNMGLNLRVRGNGTLAERWQEYGWESRRRLGDRIRSNGWRTHWWRNRRTPSWSIRRSRSWAARWSGSPSSCPSACWCLSTRDHGAASRPTSDRKTSADTHLS